MSMRRAPAALGGMVALMAGAQLLFKQAGLHAATHTSWLDALALNPWLWSGLLASAGGMACWLLTLRRLPLATAYPWTALIYVLTPLASVPCFGEVLGAHYVGGMALIVSGVFLTAGGVRTS